MISPDVQSDVEILPATLKFTAGGRKQGKNSATRTKSLEPPRLGVETRKPPRWVGSRLFSTWPSTCQSIKNDQEVRKAMFFTAAEVW